MYACSFEENWSIKPVKLERTSNDLLRSQVTYHDKVVFIIFYYVIYLSEYNIPPKTLL